MKTIIIIFLSIAFASIWTFGWSNWAIQTWEWYRFAVAVVMGVLLIPILFVVVSKFI